MAGIARDDDVLAAGQGAEPFGQRLPCLAPHDHRMAGGQRLEVPEVGGQMPGQGVVLADHAISGDGGDQRQGRFGHRRQARSFLYSAT